MLRGVTERKDASDTFHFFPFLLTTNHPILCCDMTASSYIPHFPLLILPRDMSLIFDKPWAMLVAKTSFYSSFFPA